MAKKEGATQRRLQEVVKSAAQLKNTLEDRIPFDFVCINDFCSGITNGKRQVGTAWKKPSGMYGVFCICCGFESEIDKFQIKLKNQVHSKNLIKDIDFEEEDDNTWDDGAEYDEDTDWNQYVHPSKKVAKGR